MGKCHLHLGSNRGDRIAQIGIALQLIETEIGPIWSSSAMYETAAWGKTDQEDFVNIAIEVEHYLSPNDLLAAVNRIEDKMGRVRTEHWGPRVIDIDIIFIEDMVIDTKSLTVPHSLMHKRNFVLYPMKDLAEGFVHPKLGLTIRQLWEDCEDETEVRRIEISY